MAQEIKIKLESFDHRILDQSTAEIVDAIKRSGAFVCGPVPLPNRMERFTVNRSPHVDKKSMDQFEMRTHKRVLFVKEPNAQAIENLKRLNLPAGIKVVVAL